ncbi:MAG: hypothetical protein LC674_04120, partial [Actinobacteria bacterium]|nr:hypothetical protein [Actinomycetota bacterium]
PEEIQTRILTTGGLLTYEKVPDCVSGEPDSWLDLGVFTGIAQAHLVPSSPPYPTSTNHRYSGFHIH